MSAALNRNLISNPSGANGFEGWQTDRKGMIVEEGKVGCPDHPKYELTHCFTTTHFWTQKSIEIDLVKEGIAADVLDNRRPPIHVSEWCSHRDDCAAIYQLNVELLDENDSILDSFEFSREMQYGKDLEWEEAKCVFRNYGHGARKVRMTSKGKDLRCWAGHYGSKMAFASIVVKDPSEDEESEESSTDSEVEASDESDCWSDNGDEESEYSDESSVDNEIVFRKKKSEISDGEDWTRKKEISDSEDDDSAKEKDERRCSPLQRRFWTQKKEISDSEDEDDDSAKEEDEERCSPYNCNLISNPSGEKGFEGWKLDREGMIIEEGKVGCPDHPEQKLTHCFTTTYFWTQKSIVIDLVKEGIAAEILDRQRPTIHVSEWCSHRDDCAAIYQLNVELLDENDRILDSFAFSREMQYGTDLEWQKAARSFTCYPKNVRKVRMTSKGKDLWYWAGHYGSKMAFASIVVEYDESESDFEVIDDDLKPYNRNLIENCAVENVRTVNLENYGVTASTLDNLCPAIRVSESYSSEFLKSSEATYKLDVDLLDAKDTVLQKQSIHRLLRKTEGGGWKRGQMIFSDYLEGVKKVRMSSNGSELFEDPQKADPSIVVEFSE